MEQKLNEKIYDTAVIGGGMAGCGCAVYASRFDMSVAIFAELPGGTITSTHSVENYPGYKSISGPDLGAKFMEHALAFGAEMINKKVSDVQKVGEIFHIYTRKEIYQAKTVVIATGTAHRHLNVKGEEEYANRGVSYCATCDGAFFKGKVTCIVGAGDSAVKESLFLAQYSSQVYILCRRDDVHPEPINRHRMEKTANIEVKPHSEIEEILGDDKGVTGVKLKDGREIDLSAVFVEVGRTPRTDAFQSLGLETDKEGRIVIDRVSRTNVPGVYAAGDITSWPGEPKWDQGIGAAWEGSAAAYAAFSYLDGKK